MPYRIAGIDVHKKTLAVVVADVEVDEQYQFEQRWYGSNPEQLQKLAEWLIEQQVERERRDRPLCHLMVRQQTWQESKNLDPSSLDCRCGNRGAISKPGVCRASCADHQAATGCGTSGGR